MAVSGHFECNKGFSLYQVTFYFLPCHLFKTAKRKEFTPVSVSNLQPRGSVGMYICSEITVFFK